MTSFYKWIGQRIGVSSGAKAVDSRGDLISELKHRPPKEYF
jgi:hypothetical protein